MGCMWHMVVEYELKVAIFLADEMIPKALNAGDAKIHLQRALNCLVGSAGEGFRGDLGHPTKGVGQGAIITDLMQADVPGASDALVCAMLARQMARRGLEQNDLTEIRRLGKVEERDLTEIRRIGRVVSHLLQAAAEALWSAEGIRTAPTPAAQAAEPRVDVLGGDLVFR